MFTFETLMLFVVVPATFYVMFLVVPVFQIGSATEGLLFGYVITKGPVFAAVINPRCFKMRYKLDSDK